MTFIGPLMMYNNFSVTVHGELGTKAKSLRITSESSRSRITGLSISLLTSFVLTRLAYFDYNLFNLHVAMCDNDNVVTDEVKLINK
jgi:hypothetical protein